MYFITFVSSKFELIYSGTEYFKMLKEASEKLKLKDLSMGMSSDFEQAILNGSTYLRLGTLILGKRKLSN